MGKKLTKADRDLLRYLLKTADGKVKKVKFKLDNIVCKKKSGTHYFNADVVTSVIMDDGDELELHRFRGEGAENGSFNVFVDVPFRLFTITS